MLLDCLVIKLWKLIKLMKKKGKLFATTLLLVCILSMTFTTLLVQSRSPSELTIKITGEGSVTATSVKTGKVFTFNSPISTQKVGRGTVELVFSPVEGYHVSAIVENGVYLSSFVESYTFNNDPKDYMFEVIFSLDGTATVPTVPESGTANIFLSSGARLTFGETGGGTATGEKIDIPDWVLTWEISTNFATGEVTVTLTYDGIVDPNWYLIRADSIDALRSDLNKDLIVNGDDVSDLANLIKLNDEEPTYDSIYDLDNNGFLNELDVHVVNSNIGAILEQIPWVIDTDANTITFTTDSFSIWGVR